MTRLMALEPTRMTGKTKELLDSVLAGHGKVSNMIRTLANSLAALEGYLAFSGALEKGRLDPKLREGLALAQFGVSFDQSKKWLPSSYTYQVQRSFHIYQAILCVLS